MKQFEISVGSVTILSLSQMEEGELEVVCLILVIDLIPDHIFLRLLQLVSKYFLYKRFLL